MTKKPAKPATRLVDLWVVRRTLYVADNQRTTWRPTPTRDLGDDIENAPVAGFVRFDPGAILPADVNPELLPAWESSGLISRVTVRTNTEES